MILLSTSNFLSALRFAGFVLIAILVLLLMVTIHELGHYIAGRVLGFKIKEFSVGFGPKLVSKKNKRGETISLRAFPLGGFCAFYGEEAGEQSIVEGKKPDPFELSKPEEQEVSKDDYFNNQKPWKRIVVFLAGATFNILSAFIFSFIFILVVGFSAPVITTIYPTTTGENPNAQIIHVGDVIREVNGVKIDNLNPYDRLMVGIDAETLELTVEREGVADYLVLSGFTKVNCLDSEGKPFSGVGFFCGEATVRRSSVATAAWQAFPLTYDFGVSILKSLGGMFTGAVKLTDMSGPVGTIGMIASYSQENINFLFLMLPLIAVNLGVFNLLPIPSLDGSKIVFTVIEWIRKKPLKQSIEMWIHFIGIIFLLGFVILIDLMKLFV